jgi:hypothetical protein
VCPVRGDHQVTAIDGDLDVLVRIEPGQLRADDIPLVIDVLLDAHRTGGERQAALQPTEDIWQQLRSVNGRRHDSSSH